MLGDSGACLVNEATASSCLVSCSCFAGQPTFADSFQKFLFSEKHLVMLLAFESLTGLQTSMQKRACLETEPPAWIWKGRPWVWIKLIPHYNPNPTNSDQTTKKQNSTPESLVMCPQKTFMATEMMDWAQPQCQCQWTQNQHLEKSQISQSDKQKIPHN